MRTFRLFCFFHFVLLGQLSASNALKNYPPGCDTLVTTDGRVYLVHVEWQNEREVHYTRCNSGTEAIYALPLDKVRAIKLYKGSVLEEKAVQPPPRVIPAVPPVVEKKPLLRDTFDLLVLGNGQKLRIMLLEQDYLNTYYRLYDHPEDDREYCVPNGQVRSLTIAKSHRQNTKAQGSLVVALVVLLGLILLLIVL